MEIPTLTEQREYWNTLLPKSLNWENGPDNGRRADRVLKEVVRRARPNLRILDVGCGTGWMSRKLAEYGEVTAVDFASAVIHNLQEKYPSVKWVDGDFLSVELPEDYYDIVCSMETIAHVSDQGSFAHRIARVLRVDGVLLLTTQNEYIWTRTSWLRPPGNGQIRNWPSKSRLKELFSESFVIERISTCAPGGDRGLPRLFTNRYTAAMGHALLGRKSWVAMLESLGLGRSLFVVAKRTRSSGSSLS
jgi:SAM-dependent methyltransferase